MFIAGLRQSRIVAPLVLDGLMTGPPFRADAAFVARARAPGDVVVLDNVAAHRVDSILQAVAAPGGPILYLPYSPDLNASSSCSPGSRLLWQGHRAHQA